MGRFRFSKAAVVKTGKLYGVQGQMAKRALLHRKAPGDPSGDFQVDRSSPSATVGLDEWQHWDKTQNRIRLKMGPIYGTGQRPVP